jgi:hypothetical protein
MNSLLKVALISIAAAFFMSAAFGPRIGTVFAMHDSNLGVNTWLASDNSTQRHTIDLNNGPSGSSAEAGAATTSEEVIDESTEEEDMTTDENGDETGSDVVREEGGDDEEDSADGEGREIFGNGDDD